MSVIYIAGQMKGNPNYRQKFQKAEELLAKKGHIVLNPANLPEGMPDTRYMPICLAMLNAADMICLLDDWGNSNGARLEEMFAFYQHMPHFTLEV